MGKRLKATLFSNLAIVLLASNFTAVKVQAASQLMDYFTPTPIIGTLSSTCWGAAQVGSRDQSNGLEDKTLANWVYWDGSIVKESDSSYHIFAARWNQADGHNGWMGDSHVIHATSKNLYGPYTDQGLAFTDNGGMGHNVGVLQLKDGDSTGKKYAITLSGNVAGSGRVYGANSLNGPWTYLGNVSVASGSNFGTGNNMQIILRQDGKYEAISSPGIVAISDKLLGPYVAQGPSIWANGFPSIPNKSDLEDPCIWYSGGKYHFLTNEWDIVKAFHFTSTDGKTNWKLEQGYAYDASANFIRYSNGTVNHWKHLERPRPYIENGHVVAFTFAAINCEKADDKANDQNGSKVIVVPFDGATFDSDTIGATFYPEYNYAGNSVTLKPGNYTTTQLTAAGIPNNSVSSIKVSGGLKVEIYNGDNFTGTKWLLKSNCAKLDSIGCNDSMSSVKVIDTTHDSTAVYRTKKSPCTVNSAITITGLGTFQVDNAPDIQRAQFTNILGKKVLEIPVLYGRTIQRCSLPYGFYIMNLYGKEKIRSRSYEVLVK